MTKKELEKRLKENGWTIEHGAKHDLALNMEQQLKFQYLDTKVIYQ